LGTARTGDSGAGSRTLRARLGERRIVTVMACRLQV
jgi:hypothetical protein